METYKSFKKFKKEALAEAIIGKDDLFVDQIYATEAYIANRDKMAYERDDMIEDEVNQELLDNYDNHDCRGEWCSSCIDEYNRCI